MDIIKLEDFSWKNMPSGCQETFTWSVNRIISATLPRSSREFLSGCEPERVCSLYSSWTWLNLSVAAAAWDLIFMEVMGQEEYFVNVMLGEFSIKRTRWNPLSCNLFFSIAKSEFSLSNVVVADFLIYKWAPRFELADHSNAMMSCQC